MAKDLFNRYIWLVDTIYRARRITFEEINARWVRTEMSGGEEIPLRTFHNHRKAIEEIFDINIGCSKSGGYYYFIEHAEDMERGGVRSWLLNTFAVNNLINESHHLKRRILFEQIPSGQHFLTPLIEAMRDGVTVELTYQSFGRDEANTFEVEPYCVKVFRQRWYLVARSPYYDKVMIYSLDRIHDLEATGRAFDYPKSFDPEEFFRFSFGIIVDEEYDVESVRLKVYGTKCKYLRALPLHDTQVEVERGEGYAVFSYLLRPTYDFVQELLSHSDEVEVLSPDWLRAAMREKVQAMLAHYADGEGGAR